MHHPEMVEFLNPGLFVDKRHFPVHQIIEHSKIDGIKNIGYDSSNRGDSLHIPEDDLCSSNRSIIQILSWFPYHSLISLSWEYHILEV